MNNVLNHHCRPKPGKQDIEVEPGEMVLVKRIQENKVRPLAVLLKLLRDGLCGVSQDELVTIKAPDSPSGPPDGLKRISAQGGVEFEPLYVTKAVLFDGC